MSLKGKSKEIVQPSTSCMLLDSLKSVLECPVCFEYILPPIHQCRSGHIVCNTCRPRLMCCPTCREPLERIRNLTLEQLAGNVTFTCKFSDVGCPASFSYRNKAEHEAKCGFRHWNCPYPEQTCNWHGFLSDTLKHIDTHHGSITKQKGGATVFTMENISDPNQVSWAMMQFCFREVFMLVIKKVQDDEVKNRYYAYMQVLGSKSVADKFNYRLKLSEKICKIHFESTPYAVEIAQQFHVWDLECLIFDKISAQSFVKDDSIKLFVDITKIESK